MKYYIFLFLFLISVTYTMQKSNGNGHAKDKKEQKKEETALLQKLQEINERLQALETRQEATESVISNLQTFNNNTLHPVLQTLLKNLQIKDNQGQDKPRQLHDEHNAVDSKAENHVLWGTGGFLLGSLPFLIGYVVLTK